MGTTRGHMEGALRIGAVDDHPIILYGLAEALRAYVPGTVVDPVSATVDQFIAEGAVVDAVLLDIELHDGTDPAQNVTRLIEGGWRVLLFTQDQRHHLVARAFRAGAHGLLSKSEDVEVVVDAVRTVGGGAPYLSSDWARVVADDRAWAAPRLTVREQEAVQLYAAGLKLTSVARRLGVTEDTARTYLLRARNKYAEVGRPAATKTDLYIRAIEDGLLSAPRSPGAGSSGPSQATRDR